MTDPDNTTGQRLDEAPERGFDDQLQPFHTDSHDPDGATIAARSPGRVEGWMRAHPERLITTLVLSACTLLVLRVLHPSLLLADTTPTGGDMGAHVWAPAYLRDHLLPHWRLSGWAPSWYAGFPLYRFYMVVPPLAIVLLDLVLPYNVAFKLVSVAGLLTLPAAAWAMGRLARMPFPIPALLAAGTLPFLFDRGFSIYGGNIASTMAGEFNFSCALSLGLLYLGLLTRLLDERKGKGITAVVLALAVLSHLLVGIFLVAATVAIVVVHGWRNLVGVRAAALSIVMAVALTGFWTVPFAVDSNNTIDMGWQKLTDYWHQLLAPRMLWAVILAVFALLRLLRERSKPLAAMVLWTVLMALVFRFVPDARLWNARMVQFEWLGTYLLAAIGALEVAHQIRSASARMSAIGERRWQIGTVAVATVASIVYVGVPVGALTISGNADGSTQHWFGLSASTSFLPAWINQNYSGYERRAEWDEYHAVNATMADVGATHGCGRALWEYDEKRLGSYGTPLSMMLLPYWTDGCIDSMEGLYFESSPSTPLHFLMAAEVTKKPSNPVTFPQKDIYRSLDLDHGIEHMQLYGIKYYMALSPEAIAQADSHRELTRVATSGAWVVYELSGSDLVTGIDRMPYVENGSADSWNRWRDTGVATWDPIDGHRYYAAPSGPADWPRIQRGDPVPNVVIDEPAVASNIASDDQSITFDVDQVGKPVLVRANWFPNWTAHGADGPFRVTPNLMVVIPRSTHVSLTYDRSREEWAGMGLTTAGIAAVVVFGVIDRRRSRPRRRVVLQIG